MPEHVHLLMSEPKHGTPSTVLQKLKLRVSRRMRNPRNSGARHSYSSRSGKREDRRGILAGEVL